MSRKQVQEFTGVFKRARPLPQLQSTDILQPIEVARDCGENVMFKGGNLRSGPKYARHYGGSTILATSRY